MNHEIVQAIMELRQAEQNFNYAALDFVDIAIFQVDISKMKINALLKVREEKVPSFSKEEGESPLRKDLRIPNFLTKIFNLIVSQNT